MKYLFVITLLFLMGYDAGAQISSEKLKEIRSEIQKRQSIIFPFDTTLVLKNNFHLKNTLPQKFPLPGVYNLPQDNMPCIVPDTKEIAAIPNAVLKIENPFISKIPNPYLLPKSK
jgi:hypothetical protein